MAPGILLDVRRLCGTSEINTILTFGHKLRTSMAIIQYLNILEKTANINIKPKQEVKETVFKYTKHKDKEVAEKAEAVIKQIEKWQ